MIVTDAQARAHLRIDEGENISEFIGGAETLAAEFLNRNIYADQSALDAALAAMPDTLEGAVIAHESAIELARLENPWPVRNALILAADTTYRAALNNARATALGIVANDAIRSAIKLIIGSLYANRENEVVGASVSDLSISAVYLLQPFRKEMGV